MSTRQTVAALALLASLSACGLPLTSGAVSCGTVLGVSVFVDGVSIPGSPAMSCATALAEVQAAHEMGVAAGFYGADQTWTYRVEFVNAVDLTALGYNASGESQEGSDDSLVTYGSDEPGQGGYAQPSTVILTHEMLHWTYGETDHCNWSKRYAPAFAAWPNGSASAFDDKCLNVSCRGDTCKAD